ncbi:MAG TPA: ATP-binding protein [Streptosporangiaceae bacterium]|nr:ATP-binding protein [Streptosporangiaceae bacterium]
MTVGFAVTAGWDLPVENVSHVHAAVAMADAAVTHAGLAPADRAAFALIATELATNLARHGRDGRLVATATEPGPAAWVQLAVADRGPGIPDVATAMADDGYSTANSLGGGLGACRRAATVFDLYTAASGTVVIARLGPGARSSPTGHVRVGGILAARPGEQESGDAWGVAWGPGALTVVIMDGLGHGPEAAEAAAAGMNVLAAQYGQPSADDPVTLLGQLDRKLAGGRGAVAGVAQLSHGELAFGGVGNIAARLGPAGSNHHAHGLVSSMGTLGLGQRLRPQATITRWYATSLFTAHSDGIRPAWDLSRYPGAIRHDPAVMATLIWRDAATRGDDAAVVVTAGAAGEGPS